MDPTADQAQELNAANLLTVDPIAVFDRWFADAQAGEPNDPNAMALATVGPDGAPSVRMVLNKPTEGDRFCFFTNAESRKGCELAANLQVALCFHWKSLRRQVRVEGMVTQLPDEASDAYFRSRSRASQIGAAVSDQSRKLSSRNELEARFNALDEAHPAEVPRPAYWVGYKVEPRSIEFWMDGAHRLHDRFLFTREGEGWNKIRLFP